MSKSVNLTVICRSYVSQENYGAHRTKKELESEEVLKFTRKFLPNFELQCGLRLTLDGEQFVVIGQADAIDFTISYSSKLEHLFFDHRITHLRKKRKEWRTKYANWKLEVVKEPAVLTA